MGLSRWLGVVWGLGWVLGLGFKITLEMDGHVVGGWLKTKITRLNYYYVTALYKSM